MEIKVEVRKYVIENLMNDGTAISLGDTTPLITGGLIDSIGMISLVRFIESRRKDWTAETHDGRSHVDTGEKQEIARKETVERCQ